MATVVREEQDVAQERLRGCVLPMPSTRPLSSELWRAAQWRGAACTLVNIQHLRWRWRLCRAGRTPHMLRLPRLISGIRINSTSRIGAAKAGRLSLLSWHASGGSITLSARRAFAADACVCVEYRSQASRCSAGDDRGVFRGGARLTMPTPDNLSSARRL